MKKINNYILKYLAYSFPFVIAIIIWGSVQSQQEVFKSDNLIIYYMWEILSWNLIIWFVSLIYISFMLIADSDFRIRTLKKVLRLKDRDERESQIINKSSNNTFFAILAVLLVLLLLSSVHVSVKKRSLEESIDGKRHELSLGLSFSLFEQHSKEQKTTGTVIFSTDTFSLSKQSILLLVIMLHLGTFFYSVRRLEKY